MEAASFFCLLVQGRVLRQAVRVSQNEGQGCADIVGDPGNPLGAGAVPLVQGQLLAEEQNRGVVQLLRQSGGQPPFGQIEGLLQMQALDSAGHGF